MEEKNQSTTSGGKRMKNTHTNHDEELGKILKQGYVQYQTPITGDWVFCHLLLRERGIVYIPEEEQKNINTTEEGCSGIYDQSIGTTLIIPFNSKICEGAEVLSVELLPDTARKSRETKLFPFAVEIPTTTYPSSSTPTSSTSTTVLLFATLQGREMWQWACTIRYLGKIPKEEPIPDFNTPMTSNEQKPYYMNASFLQNTLLDMFTYKHVPEKPLSFDDTFQNKDERDLMISKLEENNSIHPIGFNPSRFSHDMDSLRYYYEKYVELKKSNYTNMQSKFARFCHKTLIGACVHVNEKCFELILSTELYDVSTTPKSEGNSPLSMLCEGDYQQARRHMIDALWKHGYPNLRGYQTGSRMHSFGCFVAKPSHPSLVFGIGSDSCGMPVHPDDKQLCRYLRDECGDGAEANEQFVEALVETCDEQLSDFDLDSLQNVRGEITAFQIPQDLTVKMRIMNWGRTTLKTLDVCGCALLDLPQELFEFTSLTHLDVSQNCLLGLSHQIGRLNNLEYLNIENNLIEELPDTIEKLDKVTDFICDANPISKPPMDVWSQGISDVRKYFRDIRENGSELNTNLQVLVLGLSEAGKTSLINGMISPDEDALTRVGDRTIGIEKRVWKMDRSHEGKDPANFLIYDFAGQKEYYVTHHLFLGNKALYIIAFDLSKYKPETLDEQLLLWWDSIQNRVSNVNSVSSKTPKVLIVGTKADIVNDAQGVANNVHKSLCSRLSQRMKGVDGHIGHLKKELDRLDPRRGSKISKGIDEAAFVMSNEKIDPQKKTNAQKYQDLPDKVKAEIKSKHDEILKLQSQRQCEIVLPEKIYAVSSKTLENFDDFKSQIAASLNESSPSGKYFPNFDASVPFDWIRIRKYIYDKSTENGYECMELPDYIQTVSRDLEVAEDVVTRASQFLNDLGDILFYPKQNLVFLRPSFLVDLFKLVIRHDHKEATYWTKQMETDFNITEAMFKEWKDLLLNQGKLTLELLELLWSPIFSSSSFRNSVIHNLIYLLGTFDIAALVEEDGQKVLLVPEFQPKVIFNTNFNRDIESGSYVTQRWISVDRSLPLGMLKRIQVQCMKNIYQRTGACSFELAQDEFHIKDDEYGTTLYFTIDKEMNDSPASDHCEGIRYFISSLIDRRKVLELNEKVDLVVSSVLDEYKGLFFDRYMMHISRGITSFIKVQAYEEAQKKQQTMIHSSLRTQDGEIETLEVSVDDVGLKNDYRTYLSVDSAIMNNSKSSGCDIVLKSGEDHLELHPFLESIGIDTVQRRQKVANILMKEGFNNCADMLRGLDDNIRSLNILLGNEVNKKEKLTIMKWLKMQRKGK